MVIVASPSPHACCIVRLGSLPCYLPWYFLRLSLSLTTFAWPHSAYTRHCPFGHYDGRCQHRFSKRQSRLQTSVPSTNILFPIHQFARPLIFTYLITPDTRKAIVSTVQQEKPSPGLQFLCIKFRQLRKLPVKLLSRSNSTLNSVLGVRGREPCRPRTTWRRG